jgi:hypothetical protein
VVMKEITGYDVLDNRWPMYDAGELTEFYRGDCRGIRPTFLMQIPKGGDYLITLMASEW